MRNAAEQTAARQYTNFLEYIERAAQKLSLKGAIFFIDQRTVSLTFEEFRLTATRTN
jgi:hypothetical protein